MIIDNFYNWLLTLKIPASCSMEIGQVNSDNSILDNALKRSIVIDFVNNRYIGKFVVWDDSSCFSELIEIHSEENILHERFDFNSLSELMLRYKKVECYFI